jgi:hypothetical protein
LPGVPNSPISDPQSSENSRLKPLKPRLCYPTCSIMTSAARSGALLAASVSGRASSSAPATTSNENHFSAQSPFVQSSHVLALNQTPTSKASHLIDRNSASPSERKASNETKIPNDLKTPISAPGPPFSSYVGNTRNVEPKSR